ncbi:MAG TPA: DnaJ C-terminal domain-containing protein, partial [Novosphingobium sp.]
LFGGGGGGGRRRTRAERGEDVRYDLEISFEEAIFGINAEIQVPRMEPCDRCKGSGSEPGSGPTTCPTCHGRGEVIENPCRSCGGEGRVDKPETVEVQIPPGVDTGTRIRLSGKGEAGPFGAPPGDLYIFLHVRRHAVFERDGTTLLTRVPISFTTAALGGSIEIPGLDGARHEIAIPAGIQSGKQLRQRGAGMPVLQGRGRGDLVIEIMVETPTRLTARQKELLRELQETETGEECPQSRGFFDRIKDAWSDLTE